MGFVVKYLDVGTLRHLAASNVSRHDLVDIRASRRFRHDGPGAVSSGLLTAPVRESKERVAACAARPSCVAARYQVSLTAVGV